MSTRLSSEIVVQKSATELRKLIGRKEISPVELLEACLDRIESTNPGINALAATCFDRAMAEARLAETAVMRGEVLGLLHGLPVGVKDLQDTAGILTTHGSPLFRTHIPAHDSAQVALVRKSGAIITAKTNVPEFGAGANTKNTVWGATGNPFDPNLIAGGSSGGSAAALACDMFPLCTGSDTGGSLRIPASFCGVVGFRPSPGIVPMDQRQLGWTPISVLGPMGRTVEDTRLLFAAQVGFDKRDPLSRPIDGCALLQPRSIDLASLRVGYTTDFGSSPVHSDIKSLMNKRISSIRRNFRSLDEITLSLGDVDRCFDVIRALNFVAKHQSAYHENSIALGENIKSNYEIGASMSLADVAWAQDEQTRIFRRFQALFDEFDLIVAPTVPVSPFPWRQDYLHEIEGIRLKNYYHWLSLTYTVTLATNPAISIPCGVDQKGMPFGLQLIGPFHADQFLLDAAQALEATFQETHDLVRPRPDISKLSNFRNDLRSVVAHPPDKME
ncbi:MAG: amidase [Oxalobacteraceae bacterium]|mgnify:FL=1|jgi:amidase|nr:amidase [Oxalobacteraceae bacterium]NCW84647.1 amidase [Oxalobacteraceae bacterium]